MIQYILRRLLISIPVVFGIILLVFVLARVIPGNPCTATYGEKATPVVCAAFEQRYGLDKPVVEQFAIYLGAMVQGDFGSSIRFGRPVVDILVERLPVTLELTMVALLFATVLGVVLGLISATRRNSPVDVATMIVANLGVSVPVFVLGLVLAYVFAIILKDTPLNLPPSGRLSPGVEVRPLAEAWNLGEVGGPLGAILDFFSNMYLPTALITGQWSAFIDALRHIILPAVALGTIPLAIIARMTRSSLLEVLGQDYIRTGRAKGVKESAVVLRHGMRNALLPVVTVIGLSLGAFLSGAILTESVFNLTGIGKTLFDSISGRDYIVLQGVTVLVAIGYLLVNLVVDVSYAYLDPRIRLG